MARDPKPEHTREERKPPGLMLQGKMTLSVLFVIDPHLGPQSPVLCPAHGQVQQEWGLRSSKRRLEGDCDQTPARVLRAVTGRGARVAGHGQRGDLALLRGRCKEGPAELEDRAGGRPCVRELGGVSCVGWKADRGDATP